MPSFTQKKLDFQLNYDDKIPSTLLGNTNFIHHMLINLIGNAIKFTDKGKIILSANYLKTENDKIFVELSVIDTGIGIPEDKLDVIFEAFAKLTPSYQGVYKGNGLGLHFVQKFVEKLQEIIKAQSALEKGTKFTIVIPLMQGKETKAFSRKENNKNLTSSNLEYQIGPVVSNESVINNIDEPIAHAFKREKYRILVVEDDAIAAKVVSMYLKPLNCVVEIAAFGEDALRKVKNNIYNLIYMDIGLPDKNGYQVTQEIRLWEKEMGRQPIPIIALTAHVGKVSKKKCLEFGLNLVVNKPTSQVAIKNHIDRFLKKGFKKTTSPHIKEIALTRTELPVIDWQHGINAYKTAEIQKELLDMFKKEVDKSLPNIHKYFESKNWNKLQAIAHKFKGSTSFCGAPRLRVATTELNEVLINDIKNEDTIKACFDIFLFELNCFLKAYKESK